MTTKPAAFRDDGEVVELDVAQKEWVLAARPVLLEIAQRYNVLITYKELAAQFEAATGIKTKMLVVNWIGPVLVGVAHDCGERNEPMLTAFCVRADGTMGKHYAKAVEEVYKLEPEDLEIHAAEERLKGHVHFGAKIPADGGRATLPPQVARKRSAARKAAAAERPARPMCPTCHLELPATGQCDMCNAHM